MDINAAFNDLQAAANADPDHVRLARERRESFATAFEPQTDVLEVVPSGSLARKTQRDPINDVDVIIIFDASAHPAWGEDGESAGDALSYTGRRVNEHLGVTNGTVEKLVRLAKPRNHAVKCFIDPPEDKDAFTVDAMPALRQADGSLLVPEKLSSKWIPTNPEYLIREVEKRQSTWDEFIPLVRVLKLWKDVQDTGLKSLTVEVLALHHLPSESNRPKALQRFFTTVERELDYPILDPAGLCGEVQPDLDLSKAREAVTAAAKASWQAVDAQDRGDTDRSACLWYSIFGGDFPQPPGGCPADSSGSGFGPFAIGVGTSVPRPVTDVPQG